MSRAKVKSYFNSYKLSHVISSIIGQKIKIWGINVFVYLAKKQMIGFKSHQEHY